MKSRFEYALVLQVSLVALLTTAALGTAFGRDNDLPDIVPDSRGGGPGGGFRPPRPDGEDSPRERCADQEAMLALASREDRQCNWSGANGQPSPRAPLPVAAVCVGTRNVRTSNCSGHVSCRVGSGATVTALVACAPDARGLCPSAANCFSNSARDEADLCRSETDQPPIRPMPPNTRRIPDPTLRSRPLPPPPGVEG